MTYQETMKALEAAGTAQNRKVYKRHGAGENLFGVSFAVLGAMAKRIKQDHALAIALWRSGNCDARQLASMIADPAQMTAAEMEEWVESITNYGEADAIARVVAKSPLAAKRRETWMKSKTDFTAQTGYNLLSNAALNDESLPDEYFEKHLSVIEKRIAKAGNRTRHSMNGALISIGVRNDRLYKLAVAAAKRIGKVEVDHGETGCKTPDAIAYIEKTLAHRRKKK